MKDALDVRRESCRRVVVGGNGEHGTQMIDDSWAGLFHGVKHVGEIAKLSADGRDPVLDPGETGRDDGAVKDETRLIPGGKHADQRGADQPGPITAMTASGISER